MTDNILEEKLESYIDNFDTKVEYDNNDLLVPQQKLSLSFIDNIFRIVNTNYGYHKHDNKEIEGATFIINLHLTENELEATKSSNKELIENNMKFINLTLCDQFKNYSIVSINDRRKIMKDMIVFILTSMRNLNKMRESITKENKKIVKKTSTRDLTKDRKQEDIGSIIIFTIALLGNYNE